MSRTEILMWSQNCHIFWLVLNTFIIFFIWYWYRQFKGRFVDASEIWWFAIPSFILVPINIYNLIMLWSAPSWYLDFWGY